MHERVSPCFLSLASLPLALLLPQDLVLDINTGPADAVDSNPRHLAAFGNKVLFRAETSVGAEPWIGDARGVALLSDLNPGLSSSEPDRFVSLGNGLAIFTAETPGHGRELWATDGTDAGTELIYEFQAGEDGMYDNWGSAGSPAGFVPATVVMNSEAYFQASDGVFGGELWKTDGTAGGTARVTDIVAGSDFTTFEEIVAAGSTLFFRVGNDLWRSDGTPGGAVPLAPGAFSLPSRLFDAGGVLVFDATTPGNGRELWKSDGTDAGTKLAFDLSPGADSTTFGANRFFIAGELYFEVASSPSAPSGLWRTDGTPAGTGVVSTLSPSFNHFLHMGETDNGVVFMHGSSGLFLTKGTPGSETFLDGVNAHLVNRTQYAGGRFYFVPFTSAELQATDGLTVDSYELNPGAVESVGLLWSAVVGDEVFFPARSPLVGLEPWVIDPQGPSLVQDLAPQPDSASASPDGLVRLNDVVLFQAEREGLGRDLWVTDGTALGTEVLLEIGAVGTTIHGPHAVGPFAYFESISSLADGVWRTDGTAAGTQQIAAGPWGLDWYGPTSQGSAIAVNGFPTHRVYSTHGGGLTQLFDSEDEVEAVQFQGDVWFSATVPGAKGLYRTDGSAANTSLAVQTVTGQGGSYPKSLRVVDDHLFFTLSQPNDEHELWATDGTQAGTVLVETLPANAQGSGVIHPVAAEGAMYFLFRSDVTGRELWRADLNGAELVVDAEPGPADGVASTGAGSLVVLGSKVLFWGQTTEALYAYDTQADQLVVVESGFTGPFAGSLNPVLFAPIEVAGGGDVGVFGADLGLGVEGWRTDGSPAGSSALFDLNTHPGGASNPADFVRLGERLLFAGEDGIHGRELFSIPFLDAGDWAADTFGKGCDGSTSPAPVIQASGSAAAGETLSIGAAGALPGKIGVLFYGFSGRPFTFGPDCQLLTGIPFTSLAGAVADIDGAVSVDIPAPTSPTIFGVPIYLQWLFDDLGGAFAGAASASNGLEVLVGP